MIDSRQPSLFGAGHAIDVGFAQRIALVTAGEMKNAYVIVGGQMGPFGGGGERLLVDFDA